MSVVIVAKLQTNNHKRRIATTTVDKKGHPFQTILTGPVLFRALSFVQMCVCVSSHYKYETALVFYSTCMYMISIQHVSKLCSSTGLIISYFLLLFSYWLTEICMFRGRRQLLQHSPTKPARKQQTTKLYGRKTTNKKQTKKKESRRRVNQDKNETQENKRHGETKIRKGVPRRNRRNI